MVSPSERVPVAYRIVRDRYAMLDGSGAARFGARWNSPGRHVVYAGESFAIAILERLVHLGSARIPDNQVFSVITIPPQVDVEVLDPNAVPEWDADDMAASRRFGDAWHEERRTAVLSVPSAVTRIDRNILLNPRHRDFTRITATRPAAVPWDRRLFGLDGRRSRR
jgi:RES domain-containing protein